jgi:hypothetical protein
VRLQAAPSLAQLKPYAYQASRVELAYLLRTSVPREHPKKVTPGLSQ